jgi:hypothetical protein
MGPPLSLVMAGVLSGHNSSVVVGVVAEFGATVSVRFPTLVTSETS